jgi:hypothetical protein
VTELLKMIGRRKGTAFVLSCLAAATVLWTARDGCRVKVRDLEIQARTNSLTHPANAPNK